MSDPLPDRLPAPVFLDRKTPPHLVTLVLLAGLATLTQNIFLPSLPAMAEDFRADYGLVQLSISLYLLVNAAIQLVAGPLSDRFGRRPVILGAILIFLVATVGTLLAPTIEVFLGFRMMQAAVASTIVLSRAAVRDMVSQDRAASMIGYVTMGVALVPMMAPMVGGLLEELFGWRATLVLILVCGVLGLGLAWADLGETAARHEGGFRAQIAQYPELLSARRFWGYCLGAGFGAGAFYAYLGGAPFIGTEIYHLSPAVLGFYFGAPALGYMAGNFLSGRYVLRFGTNRMALCGSFVTTSGLLLLVVLDALQLAPVWMFFGLFVSVGLGNGMTLPAATAGMLSVRPRLAGTASGIGAAFMIGVGAVLAAVAGAILKPGVGAMPLLLIMLASSLASVASILYVIRRERRLGLPG